MAQIAKNTLTISILQAVISFTKTEKQ